MSDTQPLHREILEAALVRRTLPLEALVQLLLEHLAARDPEFRREYEDFVEDHGAPSPLYGADRARPPEPDEAERRDAAAAQVLLRRMLDGPEDHLRAALRAVPEPLRRRVTEGLLAASREQMTLDARRAALLAEAGEALAAIVEPGGALLVEATTLRAGAAKAAGDYARAGELYDLARTLVRNADVRLHLRTLALLDSFEGSYLRERREWKKAERRLARSIAYFRCAREFRESVFPLLTLAILNYDRGEPAAALGYAVRALEEIDSAADPFLFLSARLLRLNCMVEVDQFEEAQADLETDHALWAAFPEPPVQLRRTWLEGRIAGGLGDVPTAERKLREARAACLEIGHGYDAALVTLDLAYLYATTDQRARLAEVARGLPEVLAANDLHDEARAALLLFEKHAARSTIALHLLRSLTRYLRLARTDPELRFEDLGAALAG